MTNTADPVIPVVATAAVLATPVGAAIVSAPTTVAPLTDDAGCTYAIQVWVNGQNSQPTNATSWNHNSDGSLDIYDASGCLVASYPSSKWDSVQIVLISSAPNAS